MQNANMSVCLGTLGCTNQESLRNSNSPACTCKAAASMNKVLICYRTIRAEDLLKQS